VSKEAILAGLNEAIATRCLNLLKRVSIQKEFSITGGIAKNKGMVAQLQAKVGLVPLLCEDPQLIGALGAALFARDRCQGRAAAVAGKAQYGYSDGTGHYFITIDTGRCDGCGECVTACPSGIFEIAAEEDGHLRARVKEEVRKRLALLCPGHEACSSKLELNCHKVCSKDAISHAW
jgi:ferredoxin